MYLYLYCKWMVSSKAKTAPANCLWSVNLSMASSSCILVTMAPLKGNLFDWHLCWSPPSFKPLGDDAASLCCCCFVELSRAALSEAGIIKLSCFSEIWFYPNFYWNTIKKQFLEHSCKNVCTLRPVRGQIFRDLDICMWVFTNSECYYKICLEWWRGLKNSGTTALDCCVICVYLNNVQT